MKATATTPEILLKPVNKELCSAEGCNRKIFRNGLYCRECEVGYKFRHNHRRKADNYVYFIEAEGTGCIKIGRARDVKARMADLQIANPMKLTLLYSIRTPKDTEPFLHNMFAHHRVRGEWFKKDQEIIDYINDLEGEEKLYA